KKLFKLTFALTLTLLIVSCSSDDDSQGEQQTPNYKIEFVGDVSTTLADYNFGVNFISNGNIVSTNSWTGSSAQQISDSDELTGNTIGIKLEVIGFVPGSSSNPLGVSMNSINVKITKISDTTIVVNENLESLFTNTDSRYIATLQYEVASETVEITYETDGF